MYIYIYIYIYICTYIHKMRAVEQTWGYNQQKWCNVIFSGILMGYGIWCNRIFVRDFFVIVYSFILICLSYICMYDPTNGQTNTPACAHPNGLNHSPRPQAPNSMRVSASVAGPGFTLKIEQGDFPPDILRRFRFLWNFPNIFGMIFSIPKTRHMMFILKNLVMVPIGFRIFRIGGSTSHFIRHLWRRRMTFWGYTTSEWSESAWTNCFERAKVEIDAVAPKRWVENPKKVVVVVVYGVSINGWL